MRIKPPINPDWNKLAEKITIKELIELTRKKKGKNGKRK